MEDSKPNHFECAHCNGSGVCTSGIDGASCSVCAKEHKIKKEPNGLVCSVCGGIGYAELKTDRLNNRIIPVLSLLIVYFALILVTVTALFNDSHFTEILAFCGTLIGSITGYYFSGMKKK